MKAGYWLNYATGKSFPVGEHEQWIRTSGNAVQAGVPAHVIKQFSQFGNIGENREELLRFILETSPLIRVRGHGNSITFEYNSQASSALDAIFLFAKQHAGPYTRIRVLNLGLRDGFEMFFKDFEEKFSSGGYESLLRSKVATKLQFQQVPAETFYTAIQQQKKYRGFLSPFPVEDYKKMRTFLSADGLVGYALTPENDLVSVFNNSNVPGAGKSAVEDAIANGAETLDAFAGFLPDYYKQFGFEEVERVPFDPKLAPPEWDYSMGTPDVVFMKRPKDKEKAVGDKSASIRDVPSAVISQWNKAHAALDNFGNNATIKNFSKFFDTLQKLFALVKQYFSPGVVESFEIRIQKLEEKMMQIPPNEDKDYLVAWLEDAFLYDGDLILTDLHQRLIKVFKAPREDWEHWYEKKAETHHHFATIAPRELMASLDTEFCVRLAGSREEYLLSLGATPEIVQYIVTQDPERSKWLTNQFRKNPQMSLQELAAMQPKTTPEEFGPTTWEEGLANRWEYQNVPGMSEWILVQLKKMRVKPIPGALMHGGSYITNFEYRTPISDLHSPLFRNVNILQNDFNQIRDWARATNAQLASYTFEQAFTASKEWHEEQAAEGEGRKYQEKNIVHTLENGWTIQEVRTKNDLETEGNKMGHCVGSYCPYVEKGEAIIYSLRDPQNEPHVTIELGPNGKTVNQIQGKGNTEPIPEYKAMLKEFFKSQGDFMAAESRDLDTEIFSLGWSENRYEDLDELIDNWGKEYNEYGLKHDRNISTHDIGIIYERLENIFSRANVRHVPMPYKSYMGDAVESFVNLLWNMDEKEVQETPYYDWIAKLGWEKGRSVQDVQAVYVNKSRILALEKILDKKFEKNWEPYGEAELDAPGRPSRENFETEEEWEKAEEEFLQEVSAYLYQEYQETSFGGMEAAARFHLKDIRERTGVEDPFHASIKETIETRRVATMPPYKVGPKKTPYPGDTITNEDGVGGSGSLAYGEPFGDEHGLKSPPGSRGEFIPGKPPGNIGIPLNPISPTVNTDDTERKQKIPRVFQSFSVYPIPENENVEEDNRLLLQIPRDLKDRYQYLSRRVHDYVKGLNLDGFDIYEYQVSPPEDWVHSDFDRMEPDWENIEAWKKYLEKIDHNEIAKWVDFEANNPEEVAPQLHSRFALEATDGSFHDWFVSSRPSITVDDRLVSHIKDSTRDRSYGLGKEYTKHWKEQYATEAEHRAYQQALSRWTEHVKSNGPQFVHSSYKNAYDIISKARDHRVALEDLLTSLESFPFPDRQEIDGFRKEMNAIIDEGMHALDFAHDEVGREDRLFGDTQYEGLRQIPLSKISWVPSPDSVRKAENYRCANWEEFPAVAVYQYGDRYFLIDEKDSYLLQASCAVNRPYVWGDVLRIIPGSSIRKAYVADLSDFDKKAQALASAIWDIENGLDKESVFLKYGRIYGPDIRKAVEDYLYIQSFNKNADPGSCDNSAGGNSCSTFWHEQSADNCGGCTFNVGSGGPEFGYGGMCTLTHLFLNSPNRGFGRGDTAPYDPEHLPGKPSVQKHPSKLLAGKVKFKNKKVQPKYHVGEQVTYTPGHLPANTRLPIKILKFDQAAADTGWGLYYTVTDGKDIFKVQEQNISPAQQELFAKKDNSAADEETEIINKNKEKPANKKRHKFEKAEWTHPNGHPRCLRCGHEEPIGGYCNSSYRDICAEKEHKGFFVALFLKKETAKKIVQKDGEDVDNLHVTLCYCEDVDKLGEEKIEKAIEVIRGVAAEHQPLEGKIGGWGRFTGSETSENKEVIFAVPDVPGLTNLREELNERLTAIDVAPRDDHGYTPHITLAYVEEDQEYEPELPENVALVFDEITVKAGDKIIKINLNDNINKEETVDHNAAAKRIKLKPKYQPGDHVLWKYMGLPFEIFPATILEIVSTTYPQIIYKIHTKYYSDAIGEKTQNVYEDQLFPAQQNLFSSTRNVMNNLEATKKVKPKYSVGENVIFRYFKYSEDPNALIGTGDWFEWPATILEIQYISPTPDWNSYRVRIEKNLSGEDLQEPIDIPVNEKDLSPAQQNLFSSEAAKKIKPKFKYQIGDNVLWFDRIRQVVYPATVIEQSVSKGTGWEKPGRILYRILLKNHPVYEQPKIYEDQLSPAQQNLFSSEAVKKIKPKFKYQIGDNVLWFERWFSREMRPAKILEAYKTYENIMYYRILLKNHPFEKKPIIVHEDELFPAQQELFSSTRDVMNNLEAVKKIKPKFKYQIGDNVLFHPPWEVKSQDQFNFHDAYPATIIGQSVQATYHMYRILLKDHPVFRQPITVYEHELSPAQQNLFFLKGLPYSILGISSTRNVMNNLEAVKKIKPKYQPGDAVVYRPGAYKFDPNPSVGYSGKIVGSMLGAHGWGTYYTVDVTYEDVDSSGNKHYEIYRINTSESNLFPAQGEFIFADNHSPKNKNKFAVYKSWENITESSKIPHQVYKTSKFRIGDEVYWTHFPQEKLILKEIKNYYMVKSIIKSKQKSAPKYHILWRALRPNGEYLILWEETLMPYKAQTELWTQEETSEWHSDLGSRDRYY